MTEQELGRILKGMYDKAPHGYQVANIHLFGVKYAEVIHKKKLRIDAIIDASGLKPSYKAEVAKGIKLSEYVIPKS